MDAIETSKVLPEILELVPGYLKNRRADLEKLHEAILCKDYTSIRFIGHNIKGNAENYGFPSLGVIGMQLEEAAIQQDDSAVENCILDFTKFLAKISA